MPLNTLHDNDVLLLGDTVVWGTCMLGDDLGTVISARLKRTGNLQDITDQHGVLRAMLLLNPRLELDLETVFDANVDPPGLFDTIEFPFLQIAGRVAEADILWQRGGERGLSIRASSWDALKDATLDITNPSLVPFRGASEGAPLILNSGFPVTTNSGSPITLNAA